MTGTVDCPYCRSRNVRASLPGTAQFLEYSCRDCRRNWIVGTVDSREHAEPGSNIINRDISHDDEEG